MHILKLTDNEIFQIEIDKRITEFKHKHLKARWSISDEQAIRTSIEMDVLNNFIEVKKSYK